MKTTKANLEGNFGIGNLIASPPHSDQENMTSLIPYKPLYFFRSLKK